MKRREYVGTDSPDHQFNVVIQQGTNNQSLIWSYIVVF
ncbi:hypothetical protein J2772_000019 [Chryseobacterium jejuense]|nr:hypothetical protein [Chryseobacterium jejuense]